MIKYNVYRTWPPDIATIIDEIVTDKISFADITTIEKKIEERMLQHQFSK